MKSLTNIFSFWRLVTVTPTSWLPQIVTRRMKAFLIRNWVPLTNAGLLPDVLRKPSDSRFWPVGKFLFYPTHKNIKRKYRSVSSITITKLLLIKLTYIFLCFLCFSSIIAYNLFLYSSTDNCTSSLKRGITL